jgi:hypothetical protein
MTGAFVIVYSFGQDKALRPERLHGVHRAAVALEVDDRAISLPPQQGSAPSPLPGTGPVLSRRHADAASACPPAQGCGHALDLPRSRLPRRGRRDRLNPSARRGGRSHSGDGTSARQGVLHPSAQV